MPQQGTAQNDQGCLSLWNILKLYDGVLSEGDCLELVFATGSYQFPSLGQVLVNFNFIMSAAPEANVEFTCVRDGECDGMGTGSDGGGATGPGGTITVALAMMEFNGSGSEMFVTIENIVFTSCASRLQFDDLSYIGIKNCSFM
jgi:hypothetical protein